MLEQIKRLLAEQLHISPEDIADDAALTEDLGADSLDLVEMLMNLEETFSITVSDEDAAGLRTVRAVADYVEKASADAQ